MYNLETLYVEESMLIKFDEVASDEAQDDSQQANQSKNTFKYKSSHPEEQDLLQTRRFYDRIVISD